MNTTQKLNRLQSLFVNFQCNEKLFIRNRLISVCYGLSYPTANNDAAEYRISKGTDEQTTTRR